MQFRGIAVVTTALILTPLISTYSAAADTRLPTPTNQSFVELNTAYKIAYDKYRDDMKIYEDARRTINHLFKDAIDKALSDARNSISSAQTQMQKRQNMSAKQGAIINATAARDAAIEALGAPPVAPTPPAKPQRAEKIRK